MEKLKDKKIAILVADGFEQSEFIEPKKALEENGATVHVVSLNSGKVKGWDNGDWGKEFEIDKTLDNADPQEYHGLMLPGGVINPDKLRRHDSAIAFAKHFFEAGKPVAAICHGPQLLIETQLLDGRTMTSFPSIKTDLINAGVNWVDQEVVVDEGLVTSRSPKDLPAFNKKMIEEFAEGAHQEQKSKTYY